MPAPTAGLQTVVRFDAEVTEGAGFSDDVADVMKLLSPIVRSAKVRVTGNRSEEYDIGSRDAQLLVDAVQEFELVLTFLWNDNNQLYNATPNAGLIYDALAGTMTAAGRLPTYAFEVAAAQRQTTKTWSTIKGAKLDEILVEAELNGPVPVTMTFKCATMATATAAPSFVNRTRQSSVSGALFTYTGAAYTRGGSAVAYSTKKMGFTLKNNLEAVPDAGQTTMKTFSEGKREINATFDATVDDGGKTLLDLVVAGTTADVVIKLAVAAGKPKITLKACHLPDVEVDYNNSDAILSTSLTFPATNGLTAGVN